MSELLTIVGIVYFGIFVPFRLWVLNGQHRFLKQETDQKISQLEFNNDYYIKEIENLRKEKVNLTSSLDVYREAWYEALDKIGAAQDYVDDIKDEDVRDQLTFILSDEPDKDFTEYEDIPENVEEEFYNE